jgi:Holliday junction resolvasome RuvABC endonuclease subunit
MRRVIGLDPGGTTGVAVLEWTDRYDLIDLDQLPMGTALGTVQFMVKGYQPDAVAVERFIVGRRASRSGTSKAGEFARELIGAIRFERKADGGLLCAMHTASQVKRWATDKRLDAAGLLAATKGQGHARDAVRHALFTMVERGWAPDPLSALS